MATIGVSDIASAAKSRKIDQGMVELDPRALRLALLAPDIVEAILGGWADQRVMLEKLERPLPWGGRSSGGRLPGEVRPWRTGRFDLLTALADERGEKAAHRVTRA